MKISPKGAFVAVLLAGAAIPALGQDTPESLLPPGFDEPATPAPSPAPQPRTPEVQPLPADSGAPSDAEPIGNESGEEEEQERAPVDLSQYELPAFARHSLDRIGVVAWGNPAFPQNAFAGTDGRVLNALMRRLDAPVASRWVSIALRRALLSRVDTPGNVDGADFAAERAWLLVRMGEATAARAVVQDVDTDNFTPRLYQVGMQAALASADPAAMCPFADAAAERLRERGWALARAMCAGLAGRPDAAGQLLDQARRGTGPGDIDNLLATKVLGTGAQARRAVTIEWLGVEQLTSWRWGLATATGEVVPQELYQTAGPQVRFWHALAANADTSARAADAELAAAQGVFSNAGLVELYGAIEDEGQGGAELAVARDLRRAYGEAEASARMAALTSLWNGVENPRLRYARLVLTARAAATIAPSRERAGDADRLVASMLTAGLDSAAMGWRTIVGRGSDGWAMLALADRSSAPIASGEFDAYRNAADARKAQLVLAGLAGLGRLGEGEAQRYAASLDVAIGAGNAWTRAIDSAAVRGDAGTVALLAAVGMQTRRWERVTPEALFHIVAALRVAGMPAYARMIAVEAVTRA